MPSRGALRLAFVAAVFLSLAPGRALGLIVVKVNDNVNFRLGLLLQGNGDWTQDPIGEGYSQNMFLRRMRFILLATVAPTVTAFFQTENARLGNAGTAGTKSLTTGLRRRDLLLAEGGRIEGQGARRGVQDPARLRRVEETRDLKVTAYYERIDPRVKAPASAKIRLTNHVGVQLQFYYF